LFVDFINLYIYLIIVKLILFIVKLISVMWSVIFRQNSSPYCHTLAHNTTSTVTLFVIRSLQLRRWTIISFTSNDSCNVEDHSRISIDVSRNCVNHTLRKSSVKLPHHITCL